MIGSYNFKLNQGEDKGFIFVIKALQDGRVMNLYKPANLEGYAFSLQIRPEEDHQTLSLELSTDNGRITSQDIVGRVKVTFNHTETANLAPGNYVYELRMKHIEGNKIYKILSGYIAVIERINTID